MTHRAARLILLLATFFVFALFGERQVTADVNIRGGGEEAAPDKVDDPEWLAEETAAPNKIDDPEWFAEEEAAPNKVDDPEWFADEAAAPNKIDDPEWLAEEPARSLRAGGEAAPNEIDDPEWFADEAAAPNKIDDPEWLAEEAAAPNKIEDPEWLAEEPARSLRVGGEAAPNEVDDPEWFAEEAAAPNKIDDPEWFADEAAAPNKIDDPEWFAEVTPEGASRMLRDGASPTAERHGTERRRMEDDEAPTTEPAADETDDADEVEAADFKRSDLGLGQSYVFNDRRFAIRAQRATVQERFSDSIQPENGDRLLSITRNGVVYSVAVFSKGMIHNEYGEVLTSDFQQLERAMATGLQTDFDRVKLTPGGVRKLVSPQGALAVSAMGADSFSTQLAPAPRFQSAQAAFEMVYLYGLALLRDVPFYAMDHGLSKLNYLVDDLLYDLNQDPKYFSGVLSPHGEVTSLNLFRGYTSDSINGPVVSQFLLHDFRYGNLFVKQEISVETDQPLTADVQGWLDIQKGFVGPKAVPLYPTTRACNLRALASYVHNDPPCSAFINAAYILSYYGAPLSPNIPKLKNEAGFVTFGIADIISAVNTVCEMAFKSAWRQKWNVNMRMRPEVFGGRIHFTLAGGQRYGIDPLVLKSRTLRYNKSYNRDVLGHDTYLLSMPYIEGSPAHPAYPAGHSVVCGAASTVLKAFYDDSALMTNMLGGNGERFEAIESRTCSETYEEMLASPIREPRVLEKMTVGGEIDKLAFNIGLGRMAAGVHYPADTIDALEFGERIAIRYLSDKSVQYNENFGGFTFKRFNGNAVGVKSVNYKWPPPPLY